MKLPMVVVLVGNTVTRSETRNNSIILQTKIFIETKVAAIKL